MIELTINPRVCTNDGSLGQFQFGNLRLDLLIFECLLLNDQDLVVVTIAVHVISKADIVFHTVGGEIDGCFMEAILET
jgi:hypothetical protein